MSKEIRCYGCGAIIQSDDKNNIGFVPKNALRSNEVLCQRCFRLKNYHDIQETNMTSDDFLNLLDTIGEKNCLVLYMIDLFDFNGSLIKGLLRHINYNDVLVIGSKRDILPKSVKDHKIEMWLRRQLKQEGIKPVDVILHSSKTNYHNDLLMDKINEYRKGRDVYIVGVTNVGKSSLINSLLKCYSEDEKLITTSEFPGTTLDFIEIPLDEHTAIYDSPGIVNDYQMAHQVEKDDLKDILPKSELKPLNYQLNDGQSLYLGGLARIDYNRGDKTGFTVYTPRSLKVHRCKKENADGLYDRHMTLKPEIKEYTTFDHFKKTDFILPDYKVDLVISGLGFISVKAKNGKVSVYAPQGVEVFMREALI